MNTATRVRRAYRFGFVCWGLLAALQVVWYLWWVPPATHSPALAVIVPLVPLVLPALALRRPPRALLWAGIIALFYFAHGIATAWSEPPARAPALIETVLSLGIVLALGAGTERNKGARARRHQPN